MVAAADQDVIEAVAAKFQSGDVAGARADCRSFFAAVADPARQAPLRFWLGVIEQRGGTLPAAVEQFELALKGNRRHPPWLLQAGLAHFQLNALDRAEYLYRESLRLEPRYALAHYNLGVLLQRKRNWTGARRAFEAAIVHQAQFAEAFVNLANTLVELTEFDAAEVCYRRALAVNPHLANAHHGLGLLHLRHQQHSLATQSFEFAVEHDPAHLDAWLDLAECRHLAGDDPRAVACVAQVLAHPLADTPAYSQTRATAQFKLAHFRGDQPFAAPHALVERLYAAMAGTFDEHLTGRLGYRIPALLIAELKTWLTDFPAQWARPPAVLDLGCGTGLFGREVRPFTAKLVGVDLSASMLAKARERNLYDNLIESDLESYLAGTEDSFDLIAATDVLIYFGRLDELFVLIAAHLSAGGRFAFTTESPAELESDYFLLPAGRYAHHPRYIERLAAGNSLALIKRRDTPIRAENSVPLAGHVFILEKT